MKLRPETKFDTRNKATSKKNDIDAMPEHCDDNVTFWISGQFGAIRRPDSGYGICKSYAFINSNLLSYKN